MIHFFVGTSAELIKLAPVVAEVRRRGLETTVIASGQNDLRASELWRLAGISGADHTLFSSRIPPDKLRYGAWALRELATAPRAVRAIVAATGGAAAAKGVVHGDTVSSLLGAVAFRRAGVPIHHVEAGLRSFDVTEPFPEEICRWFVSRMASVAYCPNPWAAGHIDGAVERVLTHGNTLYDALRLALATPDAEAPLPPGLPDDYFVLVVHRQENLVFGGERLRTILREVRAVTPRPRCVFVMHALTRAALEREGLLRGLEEDASFVLVPRQPYISFTKMLARARFVITDGGSNQEECYYLGKPCLLMRKATERLEGLGENVLLVDRPATHIAPFVRDHARYARPPVALAESPSAVIASHLTEPSALGAPRQAGPRARGSRRPPTAPPTGDR